MLNNHPILVVMMGAVLAPLLTEVPIGVRVPVVVVEVLFGIFVGPHVIRLVDPRGLGGLLFSMQIMGGSCRVVYGRHGGRFQ